MADDVGAKLDLDALGEHDLEMLCRGLLRNLGAAAGGRVVAVSTAHEHPVDARDWCRVAHAVATRLPTALGADLLGALLRSPDCSVVEAAARALVAIAPQVGKERVVSALLPLAASNDAAPARIAICALGEIADPQAIETLARAARSRDGATRYAAYAALARIDDPKARRLLASQLGLLSPRKWEVLTALLYPGAWCINVPPRSMLGPCSLLTAAAPRSAALPSPWAALRWARELLRRPS